MHATIIKKSITHDRLAIAATFPSGSGFKFSITRNGYSIGYADAKNPADRAERKAVLSDFVKLRDGETNAQRMGRVEAFLRGVSSTEELVVAIKGSVIKL